MDIEKKREHIKSTLGEFFEREVLINSNPILGRQRIMTSLIDGSVKYVSLSELIFLDDFVDSCGMASHTLAEEVIWKAYKEFFERQSFIASFLFQLPACEIRIEKERDLRKGHQYILNYLEEIKYFNISLSKDNYVILAIGWSDKRKAAGLGTSRNIKRAIDKAQKEILQYFAVAKNKREITAENIIDLKKDLYHLNFDKMSVVDFKKEYEYLLMQKNEVIVNKVDIVSKREVIYRNYYKLNMNPYIASILESYNKQNIIIYACISLVSIFVGCIGINRFDCNSNERR